MWSSSLLIAAATLALPLTVRANSPLVFDCASLPDGIYGEKCSAMVTLCLNGATVAAACPAGQAYDPLQARCLQYENDVACMAGIWSMPRDSRPCPNIGTWRRGNGACAPTYMLCLNGDSHTLSCPAYAPFYDEANEECREEAADCSGDDQDDLIDQPEDYEDGSGEEEHFRGKRSTDGATDPAAICANASADGYYGMGCSSSFVACAAGQINVMQCPADLVYDETVQRCEYPGNVVVCGGEAPVEGSGVEGSGAEGSGVEEGSGDGEEGSGAINDGSGEEDGSDQDVTGACEHRADGFYRLAKCGEHFVGCSGGVAWKMSCPASLKYDELNQICDYPGNVEGCSDAESHDEEASGEIDGSGTDGSGEIDGSGSEGSGSYGSGATDGSGSDGSGEIDGSGSDGSGSEASGDDIIFDEKEIDAEDVVVSKDGQVVAEEEDVKEIEKEDEIIDNGDASIEEKEEVKEDEITVVDNGSYSDNVAASPETALKSEDAVKENEDVASNSYGHANAEEDVKEIEKEDEIIDNGAGSIEEKEEVKEDKITVVDEEEKPASEKVVASPETAVKTEDVVRDDEGTPDCSGRSDGFYALGCSSDMLACSNGVSTMMNCPAGLIFDEQNQICDYPTQVAACGARDQMLSEDGLLTGNNEPAQRPDIPRENANVDATLAPVTAAPTAAPTAAAAASAVAAPKSAAYSSRVEKLQQHLQQDAPRAAGKQRRDARCKSSDGFFALGCSTEFVSCRGGIATKVECGEAEAFDERAQSCVPLARHPLCFQHAVTDAATVDDDVQMEKDGDEGADLKEQLDHSFPCAVEGASAESACSDWFTLCQNGRGIEMYCQQGFLFDAESAKCIPAAHLPHCQAH